MKLSFDFDSTLTLKGIQAIHKWLRINTDWEIFIITSRPSEEDCKLSPGIYGSLYWEEVFSMADELEISRDHIHFTNYKDKIDTIELLCINIHIDDDAHELKVLQKKSKCIPISSRNPASAFNKIKRIHGNSIKKS
jgi:hypothetical protein